MTAVKLRILVTGSRDWKDPLFVWHVLDEIVGDALAEAGADEIEVTLVHGHCPTGADAAADAWALARGVNLERHRASWQEPCKPWCPPGHRRRNSNMGGSYCPAMGVYRNAEMVALGADICVAFWRNGSTGTASTIQLAMSAHIPTRIEEAA